MKKIKLYGYLMTEKQGKELNKMLTEDILSRYNNPEYMDNSIIEVFVQDNKLEESK